MRSGPILLVMAMLVMGPSALPAEGPDEGAGARERPASVAFTNVTVAAGLSGLNANFLAWGDADRDGYEDLLVHGSRLFRNGGPPDWRFSEVTSSAGLSGGFTSGTWGDFDDDGWLDFYAAGVEDRLYRNDGDGTFTDVTAPAGGVKDPYPSTAAGWGDPDRDGDLDLYVANGEDWNGGNPIYYPDVFWRNDGDGTFTDATALANLSEGNHPYYGRGVAWADFDNDGWLDLYISNYRLSPNYLYINHRDGTFWEMGGQLDCAGVYDPDRYYDSYTARYWGPSFGHTIGSAWADFDNDGNLDLWTTNLVHKYVGATGDPGYPYDIRGYVCDDSKMYRNLGAPRYNFTDIRSTCGIPTKPIGGPGTFQGDELFDGVAWGDFDNDGDADLWIPQVYDLDYAYSYLYEQDGQGNGSCHWTDRAQELGMRVYNTYAGTWCDYDEDGDLDLLTAGKSPFVAQDQGTYALHLYRNGGNSRNWLKVALTGSDCNRAAVGARLTVKSGNLTQVREVEGGMGCHGSQNSLIQHFGLNDRTDVDWVEVRWPCGRIQRITGVAPNGTLRIAESTLPAPRFTSVMTSPNPAVEDQAVTFTASVTVDGGSISRCEWDFTSDNVYDAEEICGVAQHVYTGNGTYHARVRAWSDAGIGAQHGPVAVTVSNVAPTASAGGDAVVEMDQEVVLNGSGSRDTGTDLARGLSYNWSFGDGSFREWGPSPVANHAYTAPGEFNATLSVKDDDGAVGTDTALVTVVNLPPGLSVMGDVSAFEDEEVSFTGSGNDTPSDRPRLSYKWDFGDGASSSWSPSPGASHAYAARGSYTAVLVVRDPRGLSVEGKVRVDVANLPPTCSLPPEHLERSAVEDQLLDFDGTGADSPSDLLALEYRWDFGDGNSTGWSACASASHAYTVQGNFPAVLTVRDDDGDTGNASALIRVRNPVPTVKLHTEDQAVTEDDLVEFGGQCADTPSDAASLRFLWDFGDGNRSEWLAEPSASHSYTAPGRYRASLTAMDDEGAIGVSEPCYISVENAAPRAVAWVSARSVNEDVPVRFHASASTDTPSDLPTLRFSWDFEDGDAVEGLNASHSFMRSGTYSVTLRVTDNDGAVSEDTSVRVKVKNVAPSAEASSDRGSARAGESLAFTGEGNDTPSDRPLLKFAWWFSDGTRLDGSNVSHAFSRPGRFTARLEVLDPEGEKGSDEVMIDIAPAGDASRPAPAAGPSAAVLGGLAAALLAVAVLAGLFLRARARRGEKGKGAPARPPPERVEGPPKS